MTLPLFVYGSLRDPDVRTRVLGRHAGIITTLATLHGHIRQTVPSFGYPFLVTAAPSDRVDGEIILGLTEADYPRLDAYEDVDEGLYVRARVTVMTDAGPVDAWAYLRGPAAPS